ncbi:MAG: hypothetical protein GX971_05325 [Firmicutes bacterium]|nr:hypothetical protein [Bacillota bacterium]
MYWKQWLQTLLSLTILLGLLEMLLPSGGLAKFSKLVLGLTLMLAILQPIILILSPDTPLLEFTQLQQSSQPDFQVLADNLRSAAAWPFLEQDGSTMLAELEEALRQSPDIREIEISVQRRGQKSAVVQVLIEPFDAATALRVKQAISAMLNLPTGDIQVLRLTDEGGDPWANYGID